MPETAIQYGDFAVQLQPDYQYSHNGYGLLQLTANFARSTAYAASSDVQFARGSSFPEGVNDLSQQLAAEQWTCIKAEERGRDGGVMYVTAHYAAISSTVGGQNTETECTMTSSVVSEPIESHPNFSQIQCQGIGDGNTPLGGIWDEGTPPTIPEEIANPYRAIWQRNVNAQAGAQAYTFLGFSPADSDSPVNRKAGIRTWMRPSFNLRLTGYTINATDAALACSYIGFSTNTKVGFLTIPPDYQGIGDNGLLQVTGPNPQRNWLVTGANMEVFGGLYKVTVDLMLSGVIGWDNDIYPETGT